MTASTALSPNYESIF